ncbi:MAG TPA: Ig-like domain-containing protein [Solirubrobacteraceae bacterium]|nr:Ig-like domain-containing protein [Solirubrobacteraceae bacterium]
MGLLILAVAMIFLALAAPAGAAVFSNASSITLNDPNSQSNGQNNATASPYPSTIAVSGLTGTISNVTATLSNVSYSHSQDIDVLLVGPGGQSLILVANLGPNSGATAPAAGSTLTFSDAGALPTMLTPWGSANTFKPVNFGGFNEVWESPAPAGPYGDPGTAGTGATLASQFDGINPNGTWSLYVITTAGGDGTGAIAGGWSLNITSAAVVATTTTLASDNNPSFTSGAGSSVTLTASVSSTSTVSTGTVAFTDGGAPIAGCGAVAVSSGQATCTTSFATEGTHSLVATYSGTGSLGQSHSAALAQVANNHTTVTGANFCNTGSITLNNPPNTVADATPYPSNVFVSGLGGAVNHVAVTLNNVTYSHSQDLDALLVGPGGQTLILVANLGPNSGAGAAASNSTVTFSDAGVLPSSGMLTPWSALSTVKPVNYGGFNEVWGSPAPPGPYGDPGTAGTAATLASTFNGAIANGTWSLYVITTAAGDGTGAIAGGWCANITANNLPATTTTLASDNNPSFTTAPANAVTLTATVTSTSTVSEGTVAFTDGGTTIPGCGAVTVSAGAATCATSFSTEGAHALKAVYSGTVNLATSNASLTQVVNNHTTVTGGQYCNTGSIALNNPPNTVADATPYPSNIFISGKPGNLTNLTVSLNNTSYSHSQDIDVLLVGPTGQTLILVSDLGPSSGPTAPAANSTLTFSDAGILPPSGMLTPWGTSNTFKPVNYGGFNEVWGPPAPAGPYGNPGTAGTGATLNGTFGGALPNGTWSLYAITTAGGDGTGAIAGGWCLGTTIQKATPTIGTQVSGTPAVVGTPTSDTATLSGVPSGANAPTGSVTFNAYGPNDPTCSNPPAFTSTTSLTGSGITTLSGSFTPTSVGTYRWTASYGGDPNYLSAATACGDAGESVVVTKASPALATTASGAVAVGGTISDSAVLSGGVNPTGTITFNVYGPNDATCANAAAFTSGGVSGNGTYGSGNFTPTAPGTYRFVASYGGDANNGVVAGACGDAGESVVVSKAVPSMTTTASSAVTVGGTISDSAALSGGVSPTGTVTFKVYGPNDATCANAPAFTGSATVAGNGTYGSGNFTTTQAGTYRFVASYGGDANNGVVAGACGDAGESVVVSKASPAIATTASAAIALGGTISDSAVLSGGVSPTGAITFKVYGPNDATCANAAAFTSAPSVSGNGTYGSGNFTPTAPGTYRFVASYGGDANNGVVAGACGDAGESVVVSKAATSISTHASAGVAIGDQVTDTATLAGGVAPTGTVVFRLYGPGDASCSSAPAFTSAPVTVAGNGPYPSPAFTPSAVGTYLWVAAYSGDANNSAVSTACGDAGESVVVGQVATTTQLVSSPNPSGFGQAVTFTATVTGASPTGAVTFKDRAATLGAGPVSATGTATLTTSSLGAGTHSITAVYGGDTSHAGSTSGAVEQVVGNPAPGLPTITITRPTNGASYRFGQVVRASYSCSEGTNGPGISLCEGSVPNGSPIATRPAGTHAFHVVAVSKDGKRTTETVFYTVRRPSNHFTVAHIKISADGTVTFDLKLPGPGTVDVLETAWKNNIVAGAASLLQPAPGRFAFARKHVKVSGAGMIKVIVTPNARGRRLIAHPAYPVVIRLWISYTPTGGIRFDHGSYGLHVHP